MEWWQSFVSYLRNCAICGAGMGSIHWLCSRCEADFFSRVKRRQRTINKKIEHSYLVDWHPRDEFITKAVHSLKGGGLERAYIPFAKMMACQMDPRHRYTVFYPSKGSRDHAQCLAEAVGNQLRWDTRPLYKDTVLKQASLSRRNRLQLSFESVGVKPGKAIVVDDIVTTGATMKACYRAISHSGNLTVWSLFYRKLL